MSSNLDHNALHDEGMTYRIAVRSVMWVIFAAVFLGLAVWFVVT